MSDRIKRLVTVCLLMTGVVFTGCSSSTSKAPETTPKTTADAELEYMAFRQSHSGKKVEPNQLKQQAPEPAPTTVAMAQPVEPTEPAPQPQPAPVVKPKPAPAPAPKPQPVAEPKPVVKPAPAPKPQPAPVVKTEASKPVVKPQPKQQPVTTVAKVEPKPAPAPKPVVKPTPKPVATPVPQPAPKPVTQEVAVVTPVAPTQQAKQAKVSAGRSDQIVSNTSLSASDGFLSRRHQVTSSERTYQPIKRVTKTTKPSRPMPTMQQLLEFGAVADAKTVLDQVNDANLAQIAQAIRIIIKEQPRRGTSDLYDVVRNAKAAAPRAMAIDALFQAYPQNATYSAQKLLSQTRYNRIDRLVVGNRIMQYRISRTYDAAITNLGYDASGKAMFDARRGILAADKAVTLSLKNYAARYSTKHASFVARRLYHWIRNDDTIEQAYEDTFVKHPSEVGVIMFRERFGEEALSLLQKAQAESSDKLKPVIARELAKLSDSAAPTLMFGYHKLFVIDFATPEGTFSLLTDTTIWPDQSKDEVYQQSDATSSFKQKVVNVKTDELSNIKKLPSSWQSGVKVHGSTLDKIDLQ
ncbi:MAG: hypothetical protein ACF8OB_18705 [Phycisphaeraceae bacterium JB051]